jgi:hypothetical protein
MASTCVCQHDHVWHRGDKTHPTRCRIPNCACTTYNHKPVRRSVDASWMHGTKTTKANRGKNYDR